MSTSDISDPILDQHANAIRALSKRIVSDMIKIGKRLTDAKTRVGHGGWLLWLEREFAWSADTAEKFMRIAKSPYSATVRNLELSVDGLYLLTSKSTPDEARESIVKRAQAGEPVSVAKIKSTIDTAKNRTRPTKAQRSSKPVNRAEVESKPVRQPAPLDRIGPDSTGELERLQRRVDELNADKRRLEIEIAGMRRGAADDLDGLGQLLHAWDRATDQGRQRFKDRVGLVDHPLTIPEQFRRKPATVAP